MADKLLLSPPKDKTNCVSSHIADLVKIRHHSWIRSAIVESILFLESLNLRLFRFRSFVVNFGKMFRTYSL